jgi:hypothetical protein
MGNYLLSLNWLILNMLFNSFLCNIFNFWYIDILRNIFSNMFNLLIISVNFLNGLIMSLVYSLVFSNSSSDWYILYYLLWVMFNILSFVRNLMLSHNWFIVSVCFLDWNVLNVWGWLWLWLLDNSGCWLGHHNWGLNYSWLDNWLDHWLSVLMNILWLNIGCWWVDSSD